MANKLISGQPGNVLPIDPGNSTTQILADYQLRQRIPIVNLSTATTYTVGASQTGSMFIYGAASGVTITLPSPQEGLWFRFCATGAASSTPTRITCQTTGAMVFRGDSGGADSIVMNATAAEFATAGEVYVEAIGLSTAQYRILTPTAGATVASTAAWIGSS
jgi:hypothetical protein